MHIESLSNGLGAQSLVALLMAIRRKIPAEVSITADTGWETDHLWNTGRRTTAHTYFQEVIVPLCKGSAVTPLFIRAQDKHKKDMPTLFAHTKDVVAKGMFTHIKIPLFGSRRGQLRQSCTQRWKIQAINQQLRRLGAKTACTAQGIHFGEAIRRVKGLWVRDQDGWSIYQTTIKRKGVDVPVRWLTHYYPLVDSKLNREQCRAMVEAEGLPFVISSECDLCPHKDLARWEKTSEEVIEQGVELEAGLKGEFFLTDKRIPLREAIVKMQAERSLNPEKFKRDMEFGCSNAICGI